ncbi:MAG TPA: LamG domain-containing protein [Actinoplanes sp.]|nr:LamG domain-containing protein [Actinoplanes sp.]
MKFSARARWSLRRLVRRPAHYRARLGARGRLTVASLVVLAVSLGAFYVTRTDGAGTPGTAGAVPTGPAVATGEQPSPPAFQPEKPPSPAPTVSRSSGKARDSSGTARPGNARPGTSPGITNGPVTYWTFDEHSGRTAADSSGRANVGTLVNSPTRVAGKVGSAVSLNGTNQFVVGARAAVRTDTSFSVAAWVYLTAKGGVNRTVVAQDGTHISGFFLQYVNSGDTWAFVRRPRDGHPAGAAVVAKSRSTATVNTWYHLVGVDDSRAQQIKLYVNGALQDTQSFTTGWNATGALTVGRAKWNGHDADLFPGRIDEVRVFPRALTAADAAPSGRRLPATN